MIIVIIDESTLQLTFTPTELTHPLFHSVLNKMYASNDYDAHKHQEDINVDLPETSTYTIIGSTVDILRELWCGDVVFQYDPDGNQLPKDLTGCPCFIIGQTDDSVLPV